MSSYRLDWQSEGRANAGKVLIFGDPMNGTAIGRIPSAKVKVICHSEDDICWGGQEIVADHINYANNALEAAQFVVSKAEL